MDGMAQYRPYGEQQAVQRPGRQGGADGGQGEAPPAAAAAAAYPQTHSAFYQPPHQSSSSSPPQYGHGQAPPHQPSFGAHGGAPHAGYNGADGGFAQPHMPSVSGQRWPPSAPAGGRFGASADGATRMLNKVSASVSSALPHRRVALATRLLLVATFFEDGARVLLDMPGQARFLHIYYHLPMWIGLLFLFAVVAFSVSAALIVVGAGAGGVGGSRARTNTWREYASYALIAHIFLQQALYGRDAPATGGNLSFLMRNLCLAGSFLMVASQARLHKGASPLPGLLGGLGGGGGGGGGGVSSQRALEYMQVASRVMLVLLPLEFVSSLGFVGTVLAVPVMLAVLAGYRTRWSGGALLAFYALHNLLTSAFWAVKDSSAYGQYSRDVKQYEFVQTLSIMGGVLMLVVDGPGALSVDGAQRKE